MKKIIVYTAIYGKRDHLQDPLVVPPNVDFVCFTDDPKLTSRIWKIRVEAPDSHMAVRSAKLFKIFPHKYFPEYDASVWVDGNILVRGDVNEFIEEVLKDAPFAAFDHMGGHDKRDCAYDEAESLLEAKKIGRYQNLSADLVKKQMDAYRTEGFPKHNGLISTMILARRHNDAKVIETMQAWWDEMQKFTHRDQLSFNYVAWKNNMPTHYIQGNSRNNKYFIQVPHAIPTRNKIIQKVRRVLRALGLKKRAP
jgi:lipopolysaccharide biosynthesis glycosyltransferase